MRVSAAKLTTQCRNYDEDEIINFFYPLFERNGFVIKADRCIRKQACEHLEKRKTIAKDEFTLNCADK